MTITKLSLNTSIEMKTLVGEPILLKVGEILWDDEISSCLMYGEIRPELWQRIWADELFHLSPEVTLQEPETFEETGLITLELALDKAIMRSLLDNTDPIATLLYRLGGTVAESNYLLHNASWRAYSVMQELPVPNNPDATLKIGFQTIWAGSKFIDAPKEAFNSLIECVIQFFEKQGWMYERQESGLFVSSITNNEHDWTLLVCTDSDQDLCIVYSVMPDTVPIDKRTAVAQQLSQVNYNLALGNFEIDLEDGELRFRTSLDLAGTQDKSPLIETLILANVGIMADWIEKLDKLII